MAIQIQGNGGTVADVDGTNFRALRTSNRPVDYGALGLYSINLVTGVMAAGLAANAEIFQARWTDATRFAAIFDVSCDGAGGIVAFAAGATKMEVMIARGWSADGSGGTAATITGNNNKLRTTMGTTLFGAIRASSTAALTAGTKTLDSQGVGAVHGSTTVNAGTNLLPPSGLFGASGRTDNHPIVLASNGSTTSEGVIIRATVPATGTWTGGVSMRWAELTSY
jgi:hypothetical protein